MNEKKKKSPKINCTRCPLSGTRLWYSDQEDPDEVIQKFIIRNFGDDRLWEGKLPWIKEDMKK